MVPETQDQKANINIETRGILSFPDIDAFYATLIERVYMTMERYFLQGEKFMILVTALPRNHSEGTMLTYPRKGYYPLVFAGVTKLKELLETSTGYKISSTQVEDAWEWLNVTRHELMPESEEGLRMIAESDEGKIASRYYEHLRNRTMSLSVIEEQGMGTLTEYFSPLNNPASKEPVSKHQYAEQIVLEDYLGNLDNYRYIALPLIQFSEFDGVVSIIYHDYDLRFFVDRHGAMRKENIGNIIKLLSFVYEEHILNWDFPNAKEYKEKVLSALLDDARDPNLYNRLTGTALLNELKYKEYYEKYADYFKGRIKYTSKLPVDAENLYRRIAIMNILVDSYTHNISAHSLVALESWFKQRAYYLDNAGETRGVEVYDIDFIKGDHHYAHEMHEFVRFMLEKGAFWTGLNRDSNYGGKTSSLFEVIYNDFVCNPLYLGTIAFSEGVTKLNLYITFLEKVDNKGGSILWEKKVVADGLLATIDLKNWKDNKTSKRLGDDHEYESGFITRGAQFDKLKDLLEEKKAFFPGGVVGKHAFLTILENEMRNIKHHSDASIKQMKTDGLSLNISVEPGHYNLEDLNTGKEPEYYLLGVWLRHKQTIDTQPFTERAEKLWGDIVDEHYNPRLGGMQQDKICASFLFNNVFSRVQPPPLPSERDKRFYPWIKSGFSATTDLEEGQVFEEWEMSSRRALTEEAAKKAWKDGKIQGENADLNASRTYFKQNFKGGEGHYKKYFHLWCGEEIFTYSHADDMDKNWENLARFRFIHLPGSDKPLQHKQDFNQLRKNGSIRIIDQPAENIQDAYSQWFKKWLKAQLPELEGNNTEQSPESKTTELNLLSDYTVKMFIKEQRIAEVYWDGKTTNYTALKYKKSSGWHHSDNTITLQLTHGRGSSAAAKPRECRFRNHGTLMQYFCKGFERPEIAEMEPILAAELLETLATKICIFDKRIVKWFEKTDPSKMKDLGCEVYNEDMKKWKEISDQDFFQYHFLVVHLSFIEKMTDPKTEKVYREDTIDRFIENEILKGREVPENFFLVIASGRGRKQWQYTLETTVGEKGYYTFTVYRPLESLHSAAENSQMKLDDIETKYLLTKILMGS